MRYIPMRFVKSEFTYRLFLVLLGFLSAEGAVPYADPLRHSVTCPASGDSICVLPHRFLIPGSVSVCRDSLILPVGSYETAYQQGIIRFTEPPEPGSRLRITYRALPVRLDSVYRRRHAPADVSAGSDSVSPAAVGISDPAEKKESGYGEELRQSGSIFRGITVGTNQGMRLESGLRLQVSGRITPDVEVIASLTDQNTPIQPEGNTRTLQEIDKVFVDVISPHFRARLGDFVYEAGGSAFGAYSRKLQGASIRAESAQGAVTLMGAASKGTFATRHFNGREGNQGPYQLTGEGGRQDIIVLAGTEKVFIDGEPMTRGEDYDYVIEYSLGQITFTRNRLITGDSRITVDFEYSDQQFQKTLYGAQAEARIAGERITLRSTFLSEGDDKDNPIEFPLTEEYLDVLKAAGDNPDSAVVSGARYAGPGSGNYVRHDSLGTVIWVHVGEGRGDHTVRFSHVGYGRGDYSFHGYGLYRYEGAGRGTYLPHIRLPLARRNQMAGLASEIRLGRDILLTGEAAFSDQDLNRFSDRDNADNRGAAFEGRLDAASRPLTVAGRSFGRFGFGTRLRHVGDRFRPLGRTTEIEHGRKWGAEEGRVWGEESREFRATYAPIPVFQIEGEAGSMNRGAEYASDRRLIRTRLSHPVLPKLDYRAEWIGSESPERPDGSWMRQNGLLTAQAWKFQPELRYEGEHRKDGADSLKSGFMFDAITGLLGFRSGPVGVSFEEGLRDDRRYDSGRLGAYSLARTHRARVDLGFGSAYSSSFSYTHRTRDYADPGTEDQLSNLADARMRFAVFRRAFEGSLNYQFSSTQVSDMVRDTLQVGSGFGNYRLDERLNELIPDPDGDLLIRMIQTGRFIPVNDLKSGIDFELHPGRFLRGKTGFGRILSALRGRSRIRIERRDRMRDFIRVNRAAAAPAWGSDTTVVSGLVSNWHELEYLPRGGFLTIRLLLQRNDSEDYRMAREGLRRHLVDRGIRIKASPTSSFGLLGEYEYRSDEKLYENPGRPDRDIRISTWTLEASVRPRQQIELALKTRVRGAKDLYPDPVTSASSLFFLPRIGLAFRGRGHLRAELETGKVTARPADGALPYEMLAGDQPGRTTRWNLFFSYRMASHMQATLTWRARNEPWREGLYQTGQVEVRAFF